MVPSAKTRGNGHKLEHRRVPQNITENFCAVWMIEHWHGLPRVSFLDIFKSCQDVVLGTLRWVSLDEQKLEQMDPEVPTSLNHAVIL